jgi:hypothetical protein
MASAKDFWISEMFILKPSGVTTRLFSRIEWILLQASSIREAAARR